MMHLSEVLVRMAEFKYIYIEHMYIRVQAGQYQLLMKARCVLVCVSREHMPTMAVLK